MTDTLAQSESPAAAPLSAPAALPDNSPSRRWILASIWLVVLLGVPLWWNTTALERRPLPEQRIQAWNSDWQTRLPSLLASDTSGMLKAANRHSAVKVPCADQGESPDMLPIDEADGRAVKFSPRYKLAFTLLNEDSAAGGAVLAWDAQSLLTGVCQNATLQKIAAF